MKAAAGDKIVVKGRHLGDPNRDGEIIAVEGKDGEPPYRVRWQFDGHEGLFFPAADATVEHRSAGRKSSSSL